MVSSEVSQTSLLPHTPLYDYVCLRASRLSDDFHLRFVITFAGIGFGMMYLPAVVGVGFYFEKKRAIATGVAVCGTGIGTLCMAPFGTFLLHQFDWRSAHIILGELKYLRDNLQLLPVKYSGQDDASIKCIRSSIWLSAGLVLQGCLSSALMRPLEKKRRPKIKGAKKGNNGQEEAKGLIENGDHHKAVSPARQR